MLTGVLALALLVWGVGTAVRWHRRRPGRGVLLLASSAATDPKGPVADDDSGVSVGWSRARRLAGTIAIGAAAVWIVLGIARSWPIVGEHDAPPSLDGLPVQLTSERGVEAFPSLSPDGEWIAYRGEADHSGDILVRNIRGDRVLNLTSQLNAEESDPAFSPDGRQIAFRSTFRNGGIFLIDRTGGEVRRLTNFGASPAWTPDGRSIVFATRSSIDPRSWGGISEGWIVDVRSGRTSRLTRGDFRQPSVSPDGRYVAFWSAAPPSLNDVRRRTNPRIRIMGIDGRNPRQLGLTAYMDWNPVWSADGGSLYFLSDRGGQTAIWRAAMDRKSGRKRGDPVRIATNGETATHLTVADHRLVWSTLEWSPTMFSVEFDADTRSTRGDPVEVLSGPLSWRCAEPSPDGSMLAFAADDGHSDIYLVSLEDGEPLAVTSDSATEGCPRWSPDGSTIVFHSNAGGLNKLWTAAADGSRLRVLGSAIGELTHPVWAPDGLAVVAWDSYLSTLRFFSLSRAAEASSSGTWPAPPQTFTPVAWSPDGVKLAGTVAGALWLFDRELGVYEPLVPGGAPTWLATSRRLIYATDGRLVMLDIPSRYTREILSDPDAKLDAPLLAADDRRLYFNRNATEANLWLLALR